MVKFSDSFFLAIVTGVNDFSFIIHLILLVKVIYIFSVVWVKVLLSFYSENKNTNFVWSYWTIELKKLFDKKMKFPSLGPKITYKVPALGQSIVSKILLCVLSLTKLASELDPNKLSLGWSTPVFFTLQHVTFSFLEILFPAKKIVPVCYKVLFPNLIPELCFVWNLFACCYNEKISEMNNLLP